MADPLDGNGNPRTIAQVRGPSPADADRATTAVPAGPPAGLETKVVPPGPPDSFGPAVKKIDQYEVRRRLGIGGMAEVFEARDPGVNRTVAIKVLRQDRGFLDGISRFRDEAEIIANINHPHIIKLLHHKLSGDEPWYLVLEYAEGGSLADRLRKELPKPRQASVWVRDIARAVQYAHEKGIIHRDLKPANVLLTADGTLKVGDFGLGKRLDDTSGLTRSGDVMGTPQYMAPEQAAGQVREVGPAADVYALGAILYEMLTGRPPFAGAGLKDLLDQVQWSDPPAPTTLVRGVPRDLNTICLKCLEKRPERRYATTAALADDLDRFLNGEPIHAHPVGWWVKAWRKVRRRPKEAAVAAALTAAAVTIGGLGLWVREERREAASMGKVRDQFDRSVEALDKIKAILLNEELRGPGVKALNKELAGFYQKLIDRNRADDLGSAKALADGCTDLGELVARSGNRGEALKAYQMAEDLYERLIRDGQEPARTLAAVRREAARRLFEMGNLRDALAKAEAAHAALGPGGPGSDPADQKERAEVRHLLGEIYDRQVRLGDAIRSYTESIELWAQLVSGVKRESGRVVNPDDLALLRGLARGYGYRGDVHLKRGRVQDADRDYWESHRLREDVFSWYAPPPGGAGAADRKTLRQQREAEFQLARSWNNFAAYHIRNQSPQTALFFARKARVIQQQLVETEGDHTEYVLDLCGTLNRIAQLTLDRPADAGLNLEAARQRLDELLASDKDDVRVRGSLATNRSLSARLAVAGPNGHRDAADRAARVEQLLDSRPEDMTPQEWYALAAALAIRSEVMPDRRDESARQAVEALATAEKKQFRDLHPDDVRGDRAFKLLRERLEFLKIIERMKTESPPVATDGR